MRLVTFTERGTRAFRVGVVVTDDGNDFVVDIHRVEPSLPNSMRAFLEVMDGDFKPVKDAASAAPREARLPMAEVSLGPVVPDPHKILCIGLNYRDHAKETNLPLPETPTVFAKS